MLNNLMLNEYLHTKVRTALETLVNQYFGANQDTTFWITGDLKPDRSHHPA